MSAILKSFFTTVNPVIVFRYIAITSSVSFLIYHLVKKLQIWLTACRNIDKIPGPAKFSFLLGNIPMDIIKYVGAEYEKSKDLYYSLLQALRGYTQVYQRERIFRLWVGWEPWVVLWRPESCEQIFADNFLLDKSSQYDFLHPWLGTGLLTSSGPKWRSRRKLLVPAFHFKILHDFVPVFNEQAAIMVDKLRDTAHRGWPIDITPVVTACALDIICETIMGVSINAQKNPNNDYCKSVTKVGECWLERLIQPSYWSDILYYMSQSGRDFKANLAHLHKFTRKVIRERKEQIVSRDTQTYTIDAGQREEPSRKAFLDLLLDHHLTTGELTMEDIREEVDTFMFEGHDTTAMALSWILFLLGHHPEVQEKVWPEVDSLFDSADNEPTSISGSSGNAHITLDKVKELKYLECIIKEGLRLCPSVPFIGRKAHQDCTIKTRDGQYDVPKGTIIYVMIYMLHRDSDTYRQPEKFEPDRFLPENCSGRNAFSFVPFSAGPRNCIGQRFAMSELKIVLAYMLRNYRIESIDKMDKITFNMEMVLRPKQALKVRLHERHLSSAATKRRASHLSTASTVSTSGQGSSSSGSAYSLMD